MPTYRHNPDQPLSEEEEKAHETAIAEMAEKVARSCRPDHKVKILAGIAEQTPDGASRGFAFQAEFTPSPETADALLKGALAIGIVCIGIHLLRGS